MKLITTFCIALLFCLRANSQEETPQNEYLLIAPDEWRKELFTLPLSFAPELAYQGVEDIRFAKGWSDEYSTEFWTYKFAWYLDANPAFTSEKLEKDLKVYFDGLMNVVGKGKKIPENKIIPTSATFDKDVTTLFFRGNIDIFDAFFTKKVIKLNVKITPTFCETLKKHIIYFEFSPQSFEHELWETMNAIHIPCEE